jgi:uncharacterized protein YjbI with pentapeptide repeats
MQVSEGIAMRAGWRGAARVFRVAALTAILVATFVRVGWACSCVRESAEQDFRRPGTVFIGTVIDTTPVGVGQPRPFGGAETRVRVEEVIKGSPVTEVIISHGTTGSLCGVQFRIGQLLTFFTDLIVDGRTATGLCSQLHGAPELRPVYARFRALVNVADNQIRSRPDEMQPVLARAALLEDWGDLDRALAGYRQAAERWPQDERGWLGAGRILFQLNRLDQAVPALARAVALNAGNNEARGVLDQARLRTGDPAALASMDLRDLRLENRELSPGNFAGRDFSGAQLSRVSLRDSDLSGSRLAGVDLHMVDFSRSRLRNAAITGARTYQLDLTDADLRGADLTRSTLYAARLLRTDLDRLVGTGASFEQSQIEQSRFVGANLEGASFSLARLRRVDFSRARLNGANLRAVQLSGVNFASASLSGADMRGATFDCETRFPPGFYPLLHQLAPSDRSCLPTGAVLRFDGADLSQSLADFSGQELRGASFRRARLRGAQFSRANLEGADFSESVGADNFTGANLTNANFTDASGLGTFAGVGRGQPPAILDGAIFRGVRFEPRLFFVEQDWFTSPDVSRANLEGAILLCANLVQNHPPSAQWRERQIAWIRDLEPRRRGIILDDSCLQVPGLAGVQ